MDVSAYLDRIGYRGSLAPSPATLQALQEAHLLRVPFENLSIHAGQPIVLDLDALFDKVVTRRRGGFCYELNGLFAALLRTLGFEVALLSAGVARGDGSFGPEFDHLTLAIHLEERRLVDVGFGDSFRRPLRLDAREEQVEGERSYRLDAEEDRLVLRQRKDAEGPWEAQYRFTLQPHELAEYAAMCRHHQTSPESPFTRKRLCSLALPDGRLTLSDGTLLTTRGGVREERVLADEAEQATVLRERFGVVV
ncbi:MAG TPA: acetyltransferase [Acidobacteria bacterium]|nr:acetyltransferase [Acidobacteriota bacterium]